MQLIKKEMKFDAKKVEEILYRENRFIMNLFSLAAIPERTNLDEYIDEDQDKEAPTVNNSTKKTRAKSLHELEERLKAITSKKTKLSYKEKLTKRNLKNRMKKKNKQDERNAKLKLERGVKLALSNENNQTDVKVETLNNSQPMFNSENKLVYSKIDFSNLGKKEHKKQEKDPKKLLQKLTEERTKLIELEQKGKLQEAVQIKEKTAWKNALAKADGQKVKDDPILLKKSVTRKEQKVRSSKKKWDARIKGVERAKEEKQKKRKENIDKRKKDKKVKKLKFAAKRGRIIPGF